MDYQQIICKETGKILKADQIYKIRNNQDSIENIVSICKNCPYCENKKQPCTNCHGTIVQNIVRRINEDTGKIRMESKNYRNTFEKISNKYVNIMDADNFMETIDIIANLNNCSKNKSADRLRAYDKSATAKTDCFNCKQHYHELGELTACEKAKKYFEDNGVNVDNASEKEIKEIRLPNECICKEQVQTCYYL